jgi:hypothetical protein
VVNSIFSPDSSWSLYLTTTKNAFDENSFISKVDDAEIFISNENEEVICKLYNVGNGKYINTNFYPDNNTEYHLLVSHSKYDALRAYSKIPEKPEVENVNIEYGSLNESTNLTFDILNKNIANEVFIWDIVTKEENEEDFVSLVRPPSENNYGIEGNHIRELLNVIGGNINEINPFIFNNEELFLNGRSKSNININISNDKSNNDNNVVNVIIDNNPGNDDGDEGGNGGNNGGEGSGSGGGQTNGSDDGPQKYIRIMSVSKELYDYFVSVEKYYQSQNIATSTISPIQIYSNVENGLGVFGAYATILIPLK